MWYTTYIYYHILYYYIEWNGWNGRCDCFKCEMWLTRKKSSLQTYAFWASCALSRLFIPNRPNDQTLFGWENTSPDNVVVGDRTSENQKKKQENMCWMDNRVWVSQPRRKWKAKNKGGSAPRTHTTHFDIDTRIVLLCICCGDPYHIRTRWQISGENVMVNVCAQLQRFLAFHGIEMKFLHRPLSDESIYNIIHLLLGHIYIYNT